MDALGNLERFLLLPGQAHDMKGVAPLIRVVSFEALLADKAFDVDWLLQDLKQRGSTAVTCIGRTGQDGDLDGPLVFLCSKAWDSMIGQLLMADRGFTSK